MNAIDAAIASPMQIARRFDREGNGWLFSIRQKNGPRFVKYIGNDLWEVGKEEEAFLHNDWEATQPSSADDLAPNAGNA